MVETATATQAASVFAALGDPTRLALVSRLTAGRPLSITGLTRGLDVTRQAVAKHLAVLEGANIVSHERQGRETRFALNAAAITGARAYLDQVAAEWDDALLRLRNFVDGQA